MAWLDGPVPHADPAHRDVRWAVDLNEHHPLRPEHWAYLVDVAHMYNQAGASTLVRVILRATAGTRVDRQYVANVHAARAAQAELVRRGLEPFRLGAYMTLTPPGRVAATVAAQVRAFAKATLILGADRREFAAVDIEGGTAITDGSEVDGDGPAPPVIRWARHNTATAAAEACRLVAQKLRTRPFIYTYRSFWDEFRLGPATSLYADLWAAHYPKPVPFRAGDFGTVDAAFRARTVVWQFGGGTLGGRPGWPVVSKSIVR